MSKLDDIEKFADNYKKKLWVQEKKLLIFFKMLFFSILKYMFMAWIYLGVYAMFGWERTLIVMFVGIMIFNLNSTFNFAGLKAENDELKKKLLEVKK